MTARPGAADRGSPLRIAIVIERFAPHAGGVENVAWQVAHELLRVGEDVQVIARECTDGRGVPVDLVRAPRFWQPLRVYTFDRGAHARTSARNGRDFDVVHGFSRTRNQDLYRAGGGSHADYLRRSYSELGARARRLSPRHRLLLAIDRHVFSDPSQRIQCSSRLVADRLIEQEDVARERILLLPNGVDLDRFSSTRSRSAGLRLRAAEDVGDGPGPLWLFPGSGWQRKGLLPLMRALARPEVASHRLWVAGRDEDAPWRRRAERLGIAPRVRFLGERRDLEVVYQAVDGMALPTRYDPFANVTLEAAAAGLPIVTSRANGAAEWLGTDIRRVARVDDAASLARALADYACAARRQRDGAALAQAARALGWERHVDALRDEYHAIAERRHARIPRGARTLGRS